MPNYFIFSSQKVRFVCFWAWKNLNFAWKFHQNIFVAKLPQEPQFQPKAGFLRGVTKRKRRKTSPKITHAPLGNPRWHNGFLRFVRAEVGRHWWWAEGVFEVEFSAFAGGGVTKNGVLKVKTQIFMKIWTFFAKFSAFACHSPQKLRFLLQQNRFHKIFWYNIYNKLFYATNSFKKTRIFTANNLQIPIFLFFSCQKPRFCYSTL